jgi:NAD(P)-dependent dehydrogenase (short-subunit alcohol dehydrogenase family)
MNVLITGCSSGLGRLTALSLAARGHSVYASMRDASGRNRGPAVQLEEEASRQNLRIKVIDLDVTDAASVTNAIGQVNRDSGAVDVLVNNAGHMAIGLAETFTESQAEEQLQVNTIAPFRLCRAVLPRMKERRSGLIVHVTSILGRVVFPGCGIYCASKWAYEALAETLHYELVETGVESVIVEPGPYPTQLLPNSPEPRDMDRAASYGSLSDWRAAFLNQFRTFFESPSAPDSGEVARAITDLVQMPGGTRPLRTVCGLDYGARQLNEFSSRIQADDLREFGMAAMAARALG